MHTHPIPPPGRQLELRRGGQRAVAVEVGGALRSYVAFERELLGGYGAAERCTSARGQSLIPWPNRLRDGRYEFEGTDYQLPLTEPAKHNAIHGLVRWANWSPTDRTESSVAMEHLLHPQDGWPFTLALRTACSTPPIATWCATATSVPACGSPQRTVTVA